MNKIILPLLLIAPIGSIFVDHGTDKFSLVWFMIGTNVGAAVIIFIRYVLAPLFVNKLEYLVNKHL